MKRIINISICLTLFWVAHGVPRFHNGTLEPRRVTVENPPLLVKKIPPLKNFETVAGQADSQKSISQGLKNQLISELIKWKPLSEKALKSTEEENAYHEFLASAPLIEEAGEILLDLDSKEFSETAQQTRMDCIGFLDEALSWKENPQREQIISILEKNVARSVSTLSVDENLKRSLAGDKMELFGLLEAVAPKRAQALTERTMEMAEKRLLAYSHQMYTGE